MKILDLCFYLSLTLFSIFAMISYSNSSSFSFKFEKFSSKENIFYDKKILKSNLKRIHSPSIAKLNDDHYLISFFGGSREGSRDVNIYGVIFTPDEYSIYNRNNTKCACDEYSTKRNNLHNPFSREIILFSRKSLIKKSNQYIRRIGNPVLYIDNNYIHMFLTATSIGGWATSKVYVLKALKDDLIKGIQSNLESNKTINLSHIFTLERIENLSPLLNISNLVRIQPLKMQDDSDSKNFNLILPFYFEIATKIGLIGIYDSNLRIKEILRPNEYTNLIQPSITQISDKNYKDKCLLAFRNSSKDSNSKLILQKCRAINGSLEFEEPYESKIKNLDSSIATANIGEDTILVYNEHTTKKRDTLSLALFDGNDFLKLQTLHKSKETSYPNIVVNGRYAYIVYDTDFNYLNVISLNHDYIKWLKEQLKEK